MELGRYLMILWRRKWVTAVTVVVTEIIVIVGTLMMTPTYTASTTLRLLTATSSGSVEWYDVVYADRLISTYAQIATSGPVLDELAQRFGLDEPPQIEVGTSTSTELMQITIDTANPILAAQAANALAEILMVQSRQDRGIRGHALSVVEPAVAPQKPSKPRRELNIGLGFVVGLAGGVGLAFLFENLDTTLYTAEQIEEVAELPALGTIPTARRQRQVMLFNGDSPQGEAFRRLRTNILALPFPKLNPTSGFDTPLQCLRTDSPAPSRNLPLRTLLVTSAEPREGKSTVVANLAFAIAQSGRKVIVVDANLRQPAAHEIFDLHNAVGLSSLLRQEANQDEAVQNGNISGVRVLTSGPLPSNPAELLDSPQVIALIERLAQQFDMVLLDAPPLLAVTDAAVLAPIVDGVVLVVGRAQVRREAMQAACRQLARVRAKSVGVVVNRARQDAHYSHCYGAPTRRGAGVKKP